MAKPSWRATLAVLCGLYALLGVVLPAVAQITFSTLTTFDGSNGASPSYAPLVQGLDGNFYGMAGFAGLHGYGTIFKITPAGTLTTLYNFCAKTNCTDGGIPLGGLLADTSGNWYGTTQYGGASNNGTLFKITPAGALTTIYSFCSKPKCADGQFPYGGGLVQGTDGNFYGTTGLGGSGGLGTVFKITPTGVLTTLYSFCVKTNCPDGTIPAATLVQGSDGNFYGTTASGGTNNSGTVFKITPTGTLTTLYRFCAQNNCPDGARPNGLVQGTDGNFYGTAYSGGTNFFGTVFKITPAGTLTTLYKFASTGGSHPLAGLVLATDGNFYGTTAYGGATGGYGTLFKITPAGTFTPLHNFMDATDGANPSSNLVQGTDGSFYGTTYYGGAHGDGTIFKVIVGLGPFVETLPTSGKVGATVKILGTNLTGASSVSFNGTGAKFTVVSASEISTTVPAGATSGTVQVTTPGGTLSSNVPFQVVP